MNFSPELIALGHYLAGEFDNRQQALEQPAWFVHLRLWQRPVPLFTEDSLTLYAEQANILKLDSPYRPRLLRLRESSLGIRVEYYQFKDHDLIRGAGQRSELLQQLTPKEVNFLSDCTLQVKVELSGQKGLYRFRTASETNQSCSFSYQGKTYCVSLGFEATPEKLLVYDKGIDPQTGKAIWGAFVHPFEFEKRQDFSTEYPVLA